MKPAKLKLSVGNYKTGIVTDKENYESKMPLHLVTRSQFLTEVRRVVALGESSSARVGFLPEVRQILTNFSDIMLDELPDDIPPLRDI